MSILLSALAVSLALVAPVPPEVVVPDSSPVLDRGGPAAADNETAAEAPSLAAFRPSLHGFAFVNSFSGSPLPFSIGALEQRLNLPERFGLCGGMSFAAADFYLSGRSLRAEVTASAPPEQGTALYDYLYRRQRASLGPLAIMASKFLDWMQTPEVGPDGTHTRTMAELEPVVQALLDGAPVMLGLVLVDARQSRAVWNNHQVLAYGIEQVDGELPLFRIYDPNYPDRDDVVLRWVDGDDPRWERFAPATGRASRITRVRGFFQMPYESEPPPAAFE
jgi:hypothetical protein